MCDTRQPRTLLVTVVTTVTALATLMLKINTGDILKRRGSQKTTLTMYLFFNSMRRTLTVIKLDLVIKASSTISPVTDDACSRSTMRDQVQIVQPGSLVTDHCQHVGVSHNRCPAPVTGAEGAPTLPMLLIATLTRTLWTREDILCLVSIRYI